MIIRCTGVHVKNKNKEFGQKNQNVLYVILIKHPFTRVDVCVYGRE